MQKVPSLLIRSRMQHSHSDKRALLTQASFPFEVCGGVMMYTSIFRFRCESSENESGSLSGWKGGIENVP
jgi:hypothetical protein